MSLWFCRHCSNTLDCSRVLKTVICLGRDNCITMWLNIEVFWDITAYRRGNNYLRHTVEVLNLQRYDALKFLDHGSCTALDILLLFADKHRKIRQEKTGVWVIDASSELKTVYVTDVSACLNLFINLLKPKNLCTTSFNIQ
jgi:hypothetical protein